MHTDCIEGLKCRKCATAMYEQNCVHVNMKFHITSKGNMLQHYMLCRFFNHKWSKCVLIVHNVYEFILGWLAGSHVSEFISADPHSSPWLLSLLLCVSAVAVDVCEKGWRTEIAMAYCLEISKLLVDM